MGRDPRHNHAHVVFAVLRDELLLPLHEQQERDIVFPRVGDDRLERGEVAVPEFIVDEIHRQQAGIILGKCSHADMDEAQKIHRNQGTVDVLILRRGDEINHRLLFSQVG